jgi:hypothetical protein
MEVMRRIWTCGERYKIEDEEGETKNKMRRDIQNRR